MVVLKFESIKPKNNVKTQNKQGYSITYLPESNCLLLYGMLANSDVYLFSLTKKQWSLIKTSGKKPSFRRFYAHYYHKGLNGLIIHGGQIIEKQKKPFSSDECYILFVDSWQWRKIFLPDSPPERQFHQFFSNNTQTQEENNQIYLFGGFAKPYDSFLNDLWSFRNLQSLSTKTNKHQVHGCLSRIIHTKGQAPQIYGYSVKVIDKKAMFFGGQNYEQKNYMDIYLLCMKSFIWQRLDIVNKICPSLMCFSVYESGIDPQKLYIMGGLVPYTNKGNEKCYSLCLREMQIVQQSKFNIPDSFFHTCLITQSPLCIASIQHSNSDSPQINIFYQQQSFPLIQKHFKTDEIYDSTEPISIEQYLKAIKHQQVLSQQIIRKNIVLEELYKEIQRYISVLYTRYLNDDQTPANEQIEEQKKLNIESCEHLKQDYVENAQQFEKILKNIKKLRADLGMIHEDFQRCIETEIDEEQN